MPLYDIKQQETDKKPTRQEAFKTHEPEKVPINPDTPKVQESSRKPELAVLLEPQRLADLPQRSTV